ncbi:MAG: hypothetical protein HKN19_01345 [Halioglobus sp.]|nr:hypothetical protein [Halioglobus sp.]
MGLHTHTFNRQPGWHDGDLDLDILVSHQDQVIDVATGAEVLASSDFCEHAVTQIGDHVLTFQGHPEFIPEYASAIMNVRRDIIGESAYTNGMDSLSGRHEGDRVARWIHNFLTA